MTHENSSHVIKWPLNFHFLQKDLTPNILKGSHFGVVKGFGQYQSQENEDVCLHENFFKVGNTHLFHGTYFEIGAGDGKEYSNTLFYEEALSWHGFLVEANPLLFKKLHENRETKNHFANEAICQSGKTSTDFQTDVLEESVEVDCLNLKTFLRGADQIDFITVDVQGMEVEFLEQFPFESVIVGYIWVEKNGKEQKINELMEKEGFEKKEIDCYANHASLLFANSAYEESLKDAFKDRLSE